MSAPCLMGFGSSIGSSVVFFDCLSSDMRAALKIILAAEKADASAERRAELRKARNGKNQAAHRTSRLQGIMTILCMLSGGSNHLLMTAWVEAHTKHKEEWPPLPEAALMVAEVKTQVGKNLRELLGANDIRPGDCDDLKKLTYFHEIAVQNYLKGR